VPPGTVAQGVVPPGMALSTGVPPAALLLPPDGAAPGSTSPDDEDDRAAKKRRNLRWGLAAAAVAVLVALVLVLALTRPSSGGSVTVPSVAGQSEAAASATLRRADLIPVPALTANADVASGVVIGETPPAGSVVGKGTRVTISVSTGPGSSALPNVVGLTAAQATTKLKGAGFEPTTETQPSTTVPSGHVVSTDPPAGTELQAGSQVTALVSGGPAQATVPNVVGESRAAAEAALANAKLSAGTITQQTSTERSPGTVLEQSPAAGSSLTDGGKVNLTIAQAPQEVAVPSVKGAAKAAASTALERAGFKPKEVSRTTTEPSQKGVVLEQSPAGGTRARKGATVTIEVGELAPTTTTTPTTPATPAPTPPAASG
jgi:beta-lactam-binding protein with PASTA domain